MAAAEHGRLHPHLMRRRPYRRTDPDRMDRQRFDHCVTAAYNPTSIESKEAT
jgi:hypothetical protein